MGMMIFPGEKVKDILPPRQSSEDFVAQFGAWLTQKGAEGAYYGTYFILMGGLVIKLLIWVIQTFKDNIFYGILSLIGAYFMGIIGIYASLVIAIIVAAVVWLFGWICYNKWTLLAAIILAILWYVFKYHGIIIMG